MRTLEKQPISVCEIQSFVNENISKKVCISTKNKQGKTINEFVGTITESYASHFIIKTQIGSNYINKSFAYVDFLTNELHMEIV